jgi:hypothetical protein
LIVSPAIGCALRVGASVQRVHPRVLQSDERGELAVLRGFRHIAVRFRSQRIELEDAHFDAFHVGLDRRQGRIDRDLRLGSELAIPEGVEVGGTRRRESGFVGATAAPTA